MKHVTRRARDPGSAGRAFGAIEWQGPGTSGASRRYALGQDVARFQGKQAPFPACIGPIDSLLSTPGRWLAKL